MLLHFSLLNLQRDYDASISSTLPVYQCITFWLLIIVPSPLLLHEQLHNDLGAICNRGTGTEDGGNTGFVEEVVVLRGDDTTGGDHDIRTAEFLELLDDLRDEGLVTCREAGNTQYMDIVLLVGSGDP